MGGLCGRYISTLGILSEKYPSRQRWGECEDAREIDAAAVVPVLSDAELEMAGEGAGS